METEKLTREDRVEVARSVEAIDPTTCEVIAGYTKNMSDGGLRARLDHSFRAGQILELNLALESEVHPVRTFGEVVWCSEEIYGEGADVGLKFVKEPDADAPETPLAEGTELLAGPLVPGADVTVVAGERTLSAVVEKVSYEERSTDVPYHIHLRVLPDLASAEVPEEMGEAFDVDEPETDEDILASAEDWKPHPFRDLKQWFDRYVMPVLVFIGRILGPALRLVGRGIRWLWKRIPLRPRVRIESFFSKLRLMERAGNAKASCLSLYEKASKHLRKGRPQGGARTNESNPV